MMDKFYIDKTTNTFADEFLAGGFIRMLASVYDQHGINPTITQIDEGSCYRIECNPPLSPKQALETHAYYPAPILRTPYADKSLPDNLPQSPHAVVVYEDEKERRSAYIDSFRVLFKTMEKSERVAYMKGEDVASLQGLDSPHEHWDIFRLLNPAALLGYNSLMVQWLEIGRAELTGATMQLIFQMFAQTPNDINAGRKTWQKIAKENDWKLVDTTSSQFFNPSQGKGVNKALPNGTGLSNVKEFWLLEWLKALGLYEIGYTRLLRGSKDRKTYVPVFGYMPRKMAQTIYSRFQKSMRFDETAIRSDILTIIYYLQAFLSYSEFNAVESELEREERELMGEDLVPADFVRGFQVAFYKDLGNAVTTMNLAFLNLPRWVTIRRAEDVAIYLAILEEHKKVVTQFKEDRGEDIELLQAYRDFIVADNLEPFFEFTTAFSRYLISQAEKSNFPPRPFTTDNLRRLIVSNDHNFNVQSPDGESKPKLSEVFDQEKHPGFHNIAKAIRESTVTAQYWKNVKKDRRYTVRYGLGQDLSRRADYPSEFIAELSEFIFKYNAENAQVLERYPKEKYPHYTYYRFDVRATDIADIVQLTEHFSPKTICNLLIAYGYAASYPTQQQQQEEEDAEHETTTS